MQTWEQPDSTQRPEADDASRTTPPSDVNANVAPAMAPPGPALPAPASTPPAPTEGPVANGTATGYATGDPAPKAAPNESGAPAARTNVLDATKALEELASTSMGQIERATALAWGGRALASYRLLGRETSPVERLRRFTEGDTFRQEAFEHAAMVEDHGQLLAGIQRELGGERLAALHVIQKPWTP